MTKLHQRHQTLLLSLHHYHDLGQPHNHQHTHTHTHTHTHIYIYVCVCVLYFVHQTISLVIFFTHTLPCSIYQHLFAVTGSGEDFMSNITITLTFASFSSGQPTFGCGSLLLPTVAQLLYFSAQYVSVGWQAAAQTGQSTLSGIQLCVQCARAHTHTLSLSALKVFECYLVWFSLTGAKMLPAGHSYSLSVHML